MAAAETPEEKAERERTESERRSAGMMDWFKNLFSSLIPDFSFFGLIQIALVATGLYFLMKSETGQNLINSLTSHLSPEWQANIAGIMNKVGIETDMTAAFDAMDHTAFHEYMKDKVEPALLDIIDPDDNKQTRNGLLAVVRSANGGKVTPDGFTSATTIVALIQQKPDLALKIVTALKPGTATGEQSDSMKAMTATMKSIVNGPQLDELLSPQTRANTIKVLGAALPANAPINEAALTAIITKGVGADGKPSDGLRKLFNDAIDGKIAEAQAGAIAIMGAKDAVTLLDPAKVAATQGRDAGYALTMIQTNAKAKAAYGALVDTLGNDKATALLSAMNGPDANTQISKLLLTKENVHALPHAVALLQALPGMQSPALTEARKLLTPGHVQAISNIVNQGINPIILSNNFLKNGAFDPARAVDMLMLPVVRNNLNQAGTDNVAALVHDINPLLNKHNIDALITFGAQLEASRAAQHAPATRVGQDNAVIHRIAKLATGVPVNEALKGLSSGQIAAFFSVPGNRSAFNTLLHSLEADPKMPTAQKQELALLRTNFDKGHGVGLGAILSDAESVKFLLDNAKSGPSSGIASFEFVQRRAMEWGGGNALDITGNQDILLALGKVLSAGTTEQAAKPAPKASTYGRYAGLPLG